MSDNVLGRYDWRSNMDVPGGIPTGGYQPPNVLRQGPMPTGSERVSDWLQQYLPANVLGDRVRAVAAPVIASFGPDYYDMGQEVGRGGNPGMLAASLIPGMRPATKAVQAAAGAGENVLAKGIRAYHGSPHDFDRFDLSKVGTGEGAQAYGHGLYFAEAEDVAKNYRDVLSSGFNGRADDARSAAARAMEYHGGDKAKAIADLEENAAGYAPRAPILREAQRLIETDQWKPGRMYEVNIKANPEDFLDWDKPLSQQSEKVRQAFIASSPNGDSIRMALSLPELEAEVARRVAAKDYTLETQKVIERRDAARKAASAGVHDRSLNSMMYDIDPTAANGGAEVSRRLRDAGIPGIKYLDQGSRTAGEGSRNYVVFDDAMVEILRKYGLLPPAAVGGAAMTGQSGEAQAMP